MPTYGYRCPACSTEFEVWQRMSDEPGAACPSCGAAARRQFFPAGIVFKGTGFYVTDSRASSSAASPAGDAASSSSKAKDTSSSGGTGTTGSTGSGNASTPASTGTT